MTVFETDLLEQLTGLSSKERRGIQRLKPRGYLLTLVGCGAIDTMDFYSGTEWTDDKMKKDGDDE